MLFVLINIVLMLISGIVCAFFAYIEDDCYDEQIGIYFILGFLFYFIIAPIIILSIFVYVFSFILKLLFDNLLLLLDKCNINK